MTELISTKLYECIRVTQDTLTMNCKNYNFLHKASYITSHTLQGNIGIRGCRILVILNQGFSQKNSMLLYPLISKTI